MEVKQEQVQEQAQEQERSPYYVERNYQDIRYYLDMLASTIYDNAKRNGFWKVGLNGKLEEVNISEKIMLVVTELAEAVERNRSSEPCKRDEHVPKHGNFEVELADAVIRLLDLMWALGYYPGEVILDKHNYNTTRPYLHGKRF